MLDEKGPCKTGDTGLRLTDTIGKLYFSIAEVDLIDGTAFVFKNAPQPELADKRLPWIRIMKENLRWFFKDDQPQILESLSLSGMSRMLEQPETERRFELRILGESGLPGWVEIEVSVISREEKRLLVTVRNIAEQRLRDRIVNLYVYSNCDYFIYLDVRNNRYEMLWGRNDEHTIPPARSEDYVSTFQDYIEKYVAPEDRKKMARDILPEQILSQLENHREHTFSYGLLEPGRGYTRKQLQYLYYDRSTQTVLLSRTDVTSLYLDNKRQNEALKRAMIQAQSDPLTGVYNHQTVETLIREELAARDCVGGALFFIDLDNFKHVNDHRGHYAGDEALCFVAKTIQKSLRANDLVGRVGGDEFIAFLCGPFSIEEIEQCAARLCKSVGRHQDASFTLTCSIGIAIYPRDGADYETLFRHADAAMYHAKTKGKDSYAIWNSNDKI